MVKASVVIAALNAQNHIANTVHPVTMETSLLTVETGELLAETCRIFRTFSG